MRIPRQYYDALKKISTNDGSTQEVTIDELDYLINKNLVTENTSVTGVYRFNLTARGISAIRDRPLEKNEQ